jgi:tetratricopeptide (TPR) repeat protein
MTDTPDAVFEALRENTERPYGRQRTVRAEELVEAAEQLDDGGALVTALFELMSAYTYAGEERKSPVVFARIAQMWDDRPEDFSEWEEHQFYWRFKWVTTALIQVPEVPLAAIERWTDEMRDRYRRAGHGMQPVYAMRHRIARHTGVAGQTAYDLWATRQRTDLSDCEACETRHRALHHVAAGDDARALKEWEPVLSGGQTCMEEPYVSMSCVLLPLLRAGRLDEARSHHLVGYRFARGKPDMADTLGLHLEFCALSRNEGRGLEVLAENRAMFDMAGSPLDRLNWLTGVEILLSRLDVQGHGELAVAGPPGRNWTVGTLLAATRDEAARLAAAFDARNGTTAVSTRRQARLARQPLLAEPLALGIRAAAPTPVAAAPARAAEPVPEGFTELVLRARELTIVGRPDADTLWERIRTLAAADGHVHDEKALGPAVVLRAELAERLAFDGFDRDDWHRAREVMLESAALYDEAGLAGRAAAARARAATALVAASERDESPDTMAALAVLDAQLRSAHELLTADAIEPDRYLAILQCEAMVTRHALVAALPEPPQEIRDAFEASVARLLREAERLGSLPRASAARQYVADVAARTGEFDRATLELTAALDLAEAAGHPWRTPRPLALLAQIKVHNGHAEEAVPLLHQALSAAVRWPDASLSLGPFHALLGHACAHSGDPAGAIRHLSEAADRLDRDSGNGSDGSEEHAAQVRLELADLLAAEGRHADSVAVLESVVLGDTTALDPRMTAQIRLNLARGLAGLGELRAAAEELLGLADTVAAWPEEQFTHTLVACEAAVALAKADRWEAARAAYGRAVDSHGRAPRPAPVVSMMREFARLTMAVQEADGLDTALRHLAEADAVCAQVPVDSPDFVHWYQTGSTHYQRSRAYASAHAYGDALPEMERAIDVYDAGGPDGEEPRAEATRIAALIEGNALGDTAAATARLTAGIARCEAAGLLEAAAALEAVRSGMAAKQSA